MTTQILKYNDHEVEFEFNKQNVMVNATEMAKIFGKDLYQFTKSDHAQAFIKSCLKPANAGLLGIEKEDDLYISKQKTGTWMHRVLALKFAAWLDSDFEVWVYLSIENLLFGRHVKREQSFEKTLSLQREMDDLRYKPGKTGDDFERYLDIQRELKRETAIRKTLTSESISGMKSLF